MPWEVVQRKDPLQGYEQPWVSLLPHHISFNTAFCRQAELNAGMRVTVYVDPGDRKMGFEFHEDNRENSLSLTYQSGARKGEKRRSLQCACLGIYSQYPWIASVSKLRPHKARRFPVRREGNLWVIRLCPAFEIRRARESRDIPSDANGIYRYIRENGEIVYTGQGNIADRLRSPDRGGWDFEVIEYSVVEDPDDRVKWEAYWIDRFKSEHGGNLPIYNRISGKKT